MKPCAVRAGGRLLEFVVLQSVAQKNEKKIYSGCEINYISTATFLLIKISKINFKRLY